MADEKVNVSSEEKKAPEAPAPSGPGDPPAPEHTEGPAVLVGIRRPPFMLSLPLGNIPSRPFSLIWVRTLPRRPAR